MSRALRLQVRARHFPIERVARQPATPPENNVPN